MSRTKLLSDNYNSSGCINYNNISSDLRVEYNKIINDIHHQLFFDQDLTHQHHMFILNNRKTIENKLIDILYDRINNLNVPYHIREDLISNINKFSMDFTHIDIYSNIIRHSHHNYDSNENDITVSYNIQEDENEQVDFDYNDDH